MSNTLKVSGRSHYGLSTAAAVIYAVVWLLMGSVHAAPTAQTFTNTPMLAEVIVTASRSAETATLNPVVVVGQREAQSNVSSGVSTGTFAVLDPIVVEATRYAVDSNSTQLPSMLVHVTTTGGNQHMVKTSLVTRVGRWLTASLLK